MSWLEEMKYKEDKFIQKAKDIIENNYGKIKIEDIEDLTEEDKVKFINILIGELKNR